MGQTGSDVVQILDSERAPECPEGQRALEAPWESEKRYRALIEGLDGIVWQVDLPETTSRHEHAALLPFSFVSQQAEAILGYPVDRWLAEPDFWISHIHPDDRESMLAHCRDAVDAPREHEMEYRMLAADGRVVWVRDRVRLVRDGDGRPQQLCGVTQDITERKRAEDALRQSEMRYQSLAEVSPVGIFRTDATGSRVYVNQRWCEIAGLTAEEARGDGWLRGLHPDDRAPVAAAWNEVVREKRPWRAEYRFRRPDGKTTWVVGQAVAEKGAAGEVVGYVGTITDITERKQAEEELNRSREELRALSAELQRVREEECTRIAREIHDELGQTLTALKMDLAWLQKRLGRVRLPAKTREKVASMLHLVGTTIRAVRKMCSDLRPALLDDFGLAAAIEWQAQDFQTRTGVRCEFTPGLDAAAQDALMNRDVSTGLFRILQESLTNVARHARASRVRIALYQHAGELTLEVADDGRGMTEAERLDPGSLGLLGMRERVRQLGGQAAIVGVPSQGTTVTARVPLAQTKGR